MLSIPQDQASGAGSTGWLRRELVTMRFMGWFQQAVQRDGSISRLILHRASPHPPVKWEPGGVTVLWVELTSVQGLRVWNRISSGHPHPNL